MPSGRVKSNFLNCLSSLRYKRSDSIVAIDAWMGSKYADNSRFLFQYLSDHKDELGLSKVVWLTHNTEVVDTVRALGYECYLLDSKEGVEIHKRAGYLICNNSPVDDVKLRGEFIAEYSYGAKRINLWHGTGVIKTFAMASNVYKAKMNRHPALYRIKLFLYSHNSVFRKLFESYGGWGDCFYLTTSETEKEKFKKCYPMPDGRFIVSNYPRNCAGIKLTEREQEIVDTIRSYKYSIMYLPTFRDSSSHFDYTVIADELKDLLERRNILFIQKAHSVMQNSGKVGLDGNALTLHPDFDVNVITPEVTYVLTDYSSILADALYHRKPVLLYVPDYNEYMSGERGFASDADMLLSAGLKFSSIENLKSYLEEYIDEPEHAITDSYKTVRQRIWGREVGLKEIWADIRKATI